MPDGNIAECYAKTVAERVASGAYKQGFEHHYWRPDVLNDPLKLKESAGIFVGSMADLFGHWVPDEQINKVLDVMRRADWHIFQTLSKYPIRLREFDFPSNAWVGVSLPAGHLMKDQGAARALLVYLSHMTKIRSKIRFMSIEPVWFDVMPVFEKWISRYKRLPFEWVIIGAASNGTTIYQPEPHWIVSLLNILDAQNIPVFFKGNLDGNLGIDRWREDFPVDQMSLVSERKKAV